MHKLAKTGCLFLCVLLLAACSPFSFQNTNELLRAPALGPGQGEIQKALAKYLGTEPQYKFPKEGEWRSPLLRADLDGDGADEGVLFYSVAGLTVPGVQKSGNAYVAVLKQNGDEWTVVDDIEGLSTDIASVELADMFGDGTQQLIIGYSNSQLGGKMLTPYRFVDGKLSGAVVVEAATYYSTYVLVDFEQTGKQDLVILSPGEGSEEHPKLNVLTGVDGRFEQKQSTIELFNKFDSGSTRSFYLHTTKGQDGGNYLIVDGFLVSGTLLMSQMLEYTESGELKVRAEPAEFANATSRSSSLLVSRDIDTDGIVEIPLDSTGEGSDTKPRDIVTAAGDKRLRFVEWVDFTGAEPLTKQFGILDIDRNIFVCLPEEWQDKIKVTDGLKKNEWEVQDIKTERTLVQLRGLRAEEQVTDLMKRVPGDVNSFLVFGTGLTTYEQAVVEAISLF